MKTFGLIGRNLSHSFSKSYFSKKWKIANCSHQYNYENFELSCLSELKKLITAHPDLQGFNVTIPYKEKILAHCSELSQEVKTIGAANTICIRRSGSDFFLSAHNTDVTGFAAYIEELASIPEQALILGTGGASKAVQWVLNQYGIGYRIVSRNKYGPDILQYENLNEEFIASHDLIINTTPLGMYPKKDEMPAIPYSGISAKHTLIDLIYNPSETLFLEQAKKRGARYFNGELMLITQAEEAWKIFQSFGKT